MNEYPVGVKEKADDKSKLQHHLELLAADGHIAGFQEGGDGGAGCLGIDDLDRIHGDQ